MSRAVRPVKKRCFWWEDYAHLVKQAQKPNVNRIERWEGEEEEGKSAALIPVKEDKSLSAALKITVFGTDPVIFWSFCMEVILFSGTLGPHIWGLSYWFYEHD